MGTMKKLCFEHKLGTLVLIVLLVAAHRGASVVQQSKEIITWDSVLLSP
jgi:hypothetical protein